MSGQVARKDDFNAHVKQPPNVAHGIWKMITTQTAIKSRAKFRVYQSTQQTNFTATQWTKVTFDGVGYNPGSYFASDKFTATTAGYYHFVAQVTPDFGTYSAAKSFGIALYVNGAAVAVAYTSSNADPDRIVLQIADIVQLAATDYVEVYFYSGNDNNNTDLTAGTTTTYFSGHILSTL
jgi:hypothetical protein